MQSCFAYTVSPSLSWLSRLGLNSPPELARAIVFHNGVVIHRSIRDVIVFGGWRNGMLQLWRMRAVVAIVGVEMECAAGQILQDWIVGMA